MQLTLYLDTDGDGIARPPSTEAAREMVFIGRCKVNPLRNPFLIGPNPRWADKVVPSQNFRIGFCTSGRFPRCVIVWRTLEYLEEKAGCD